MSGQLIGGIIGAVIGFFVGGGPAGAVQGFAIGSTIGGLLFPGKLPDVYGPRLTDLKLQVSTYGTMIPIVYGTNRQAGNVIWKTDMRETEHQEEQGGKGGPSQTTHTYTYSASWAISLCEGEIAGVRRIWADSYLIYDASITNTGPTLNPKIFLGPLFPHISVGGSSSTISTPAFTIYLGTEDQLPDPTMESFLGVGNVTAYRGQAYIVFHDFQLEKFGNRMPGFSFEVVGNGTKADIVTYYTTPELEYGTICFNPLLNELWVHPSKDISSEPFFCRLNADTGAVIGGTDLTGVTQFLPMVYDQFDRAIWSYVGFGTSTDKVYKFDAATGAVLLTVDHAAASIEQSLHLNPYDGTLWIKNISSISQINKSTGVVGTPISVGFNIFDLAFAEDGGIWMSSNTTASNKQLFRFDIVTHGIEVAYVNSLRLTTITYDSLRNAIWASQNSATAIGIDISSRTSIGTIVLTTPPTQSPGILTYDQYRDVLWSSSISLNELSSNYVSTGATHKHITGITYSPNAFVPTQNNLFVNGSTFIGYGEVIKIAFDRITLGTTTLAEVLTDISERTGQLTASDIDVTAQTSVIVDGYTITRQSPARACIEQLQSAYFFDGVESDGKAKFVNRGGASAVTIPADDLAAYTAYGSIPDDINSTRTQEVELPKAVNVTYIAKTADYQTGAQLSRRLVGATGQTETIELPIVLSDDHARQIAEISMYNAWTARTAYEFSTNLKYMKYEPTDIVTIGNKAIRLLEKEEQQGVIKWKGQAEHVEVYSQSITGVPTSYIPSTMSQLVATDLQLLDIPMLRDQDDDAGYYVAASGYMTGWNGGVLFKSIDDGASYGEVLALTQSANIGIANGALADWTGGNIFDETNTVTISLVGGAGTLSSTTELAVLNGGNACLIGNEVLQYKTATMNGDGTYTLSGLLRGRRGTEWAMSTHAAGDRFVSLSATYIRRAAGTTAEIGLARLYKGVSIGDSLANTSSQSFTNTAVALECYSPVQLGGGRDASGNITINWVRRTRIGGEWRDSVDAALGEATESYQVEIWDSGFATLKRTITGITSPTTVYDVSMQSSDFGGNQATIYVKVRQVSANVGTGYPLIGTV